MLITDDKRKKIIIANIHRDWNISEEEFTKRKKDPLFSNFSFEGSSENCGDLLNFLVQLDENNLGIKNILFDNSNCCIVSSSSANIIISWIVSKRPKISTIIDFLASAEGMIRSGLFNLNVCKEIIAFKEIGNFESKSKCFQLTIKSFKGIIDELTVNSRISL